MTKRPADNVDFRQLAVQSLYDAAATAVAKVLPGLTQNQQKRLATHIAENDPAFASIRSEPGWSTPSAAEMEGQVMALAQLKLPDAECFRTPPSAAELERALIAAQGITDVRDKMTLHRELSAATPDELLERSRGVDLSVAAADTPKAPLPSKSTTKLAHEMNAQELAALVTETTGRDHRTMLPSEVRKYSEALVANSLPRPTPNLDALRAKLASGQSWHQISGIERITAEREAKNTLGKSLAQLGIGP